MKIVTETFETKDLNIIDAIILLNNFTDISNNINNYKLTMDNLVESTIKYILQFNIDPKSLILTELVEEDYCRKS